MNENKLKQNISDKTLHFILTSVKTKKKQKSVSKKKSIKLVLLGYTTSTSLDMVDGRTQKVSRASSIKSSIKSSSKSSKNYIYKLIKLYHDNNIVVSNYLKTAPYKQHIFPQQSRVIIIGDIHGDFEVAIRCLILAKCIEQIDIPINKTVNDMNMFFNKLKWIGGETYIVQLGDQIDRVRPQNWDNNEISIDEAFEDEGSTLEIFYLFYHLNKLASIVNGRVFSIIGNHEIMNVNGNFRYVSKQEFQCFKEHLHTVYNNIQHTPRTPHKQLHLLQYSNMLNNINIEHQKTPPGYRERLHAFAPSGLCANFMAMNYYTMLQIGDWLFCHGSPTLYISNKFSIEMVNNIVALYLLGVNNTDTDLNKYYNEIMNSHPELGENNEISILWARAFGEHINTPNKENTLQLLLQKILDAHNNNNNNNNNNTGTVKTFTNVKHVAIGHTPQFKYGINSICNNQVWRCDIGMSKAFLTNNNNRNNNNNNNKHNNNVFKHGYIQVLELKNGIPLILSEN